MASSNASDDLVAAKRALRALATERRRRLAAAIGPAEAGQAAAERFLARHLGGRAQD